jgi:hypothetical protein
MQIEVWNLVAASTQADIKDASIINQSQDIQVAMTRWENYLPLSTT